MPMRPASARVSRHPARLAALVLAALVLAALVLAAAGCFRSGGGGPDIAGSTPNPRFEWFHYEGHDPVFDTLQRAADTYTNPILQGSYSDPSVTRAGEYFYLVSASFAYYPGMPVFRSRDLVHWTQVGNIVERPTQLSFDGVRVSRGLQGPSLQEHAGTFYVLSSCVDCGGNYMMTASDPAGRWSQAQWIHDIDGKDPSLFFDDDGKTYVLWDDAPVGKPRYDGHRAIWMQQFDLKTATPVGNREVLIDGGADLTSDPVRVEAPRLFRHEGRYYLTAAEGGNTGGLAQVILRADSVWGPYEPYEGNPILTQRTLPRDRPVPITAAGRAEFVQAPDSSWWATFLAARPYTADFYNTGRETFLLPVEWRDGWPVITTSAIPYMSARPALADVHGGGRQVIAEQPTSGNFTVHDEFDEPRLAPQWMMIRTPRDSFLDLTSARGALTLKAREVRLNEVSGQPSYLGRRQQHQFASVSTSMYYRPRDDGDEAGLAAFEDESHWYLISVAQSDRRRVIRVTRCDGGEAVVVREQRLEGDENKPVWLRIDARGALYDFAFSTNKGKWHTLVRDADGKILSARITGNYAGVTMGLFAYKARS